MGKMGMDKNFADHLTTEEVKEVCSAIQADIMYGISTGGTPEGSAEQEELSEEYDMWIAEYSRRIGYDNAG